MDENTKTEIQSATFERLLKHLDERKDIQNIEIMDLIGFVVTKAEDQRITNINGNNLTMKNYSFLVFFFPFLIRHTINMLSCIWIRYS